MALITGMRVFDLRFPTSKSLDGSDAMNPDPDYSAAYVVLDTDMPGLAPAAWAADPYAVREFEVR